ncbi:hypothetical protein [Pseudoalteromonas piratica]|uniref:Uncharacterized protein n=1 Tax=Pseudoalteromonas piratica TaxID=1348114 RepID=A0A0A7ELV6_9GAMM|nr:hypothetical protein [Pseudoalteromonas piratica]AIY67594.1 hypothetical protein OM33_21615 [Pseudoalteromonas piratica]
MLIKKAARRFEAALKSYENDSVSIDVDVINHDELTIKCFLYSGLHYCVMVQFDEDFCLNALNIEHSNQGVHIPSETQKQQFSACLSRVIKEGMHYAKC